MRNKNGFTLVELLAVVVILGIIMTVSIPMVSRWINRSRVESKEAQRQTLLLAAQSYAQENSKVLPKTIGETKFIKATDLKKANYLKEDLVDSNQKDCMKDSFVRVYKYDKNGYTYTSYLYCEGDTVPEIIAGVEPIISISFTGDNLKDEVVQDVSSSGFRVTIDGGKKDEKNLGIDGYTYSISVRYSEDGELVEIFNSGSLNAGGKEKLVIEKSLSDYTNITTVSEFMITVEAYNRDGGYKKVTANSKYGDNTPPICGEIEGQAGEEEWFNTPHTITVSVKCIDEENGSGCVKEVYTKTFDQEMNYGEIPIKDNAGNTTNCEVRVHHDWTRPTLVVTAYTRNSDGTKGSKVGEATANHANNIVHLNSYTGNKNGWLNASKFPYGLVYVVTTTDNVLLNGGRWSENARGLWGNNDNIDTLITTSTKSFTTSSDELSFALVDDGIRKARFVLDDKAGNSVTVNITAKMDRVKPSCSASKGNIGSEAGVSVSVSCSDGESGCASSNALSYSGIKSSSSYTVSDNAGNTCQASVSVSSYNCHPYDCNPHDCNPYDCNPHKVACGTYTCTPYPCCPNVGGCELTSYMCSTCTKYCTKYDTCYETCYDTCYKTCYR